jgi:hypothetical protein|tara:strand:- start:50 stop:508 length:459 start_codon:yes stop_codon:yes gene_type:complete
MRNWISIFVSALACFASVDAAKRPNIVLIMADDLGFADLGCSGSEIQTPNLDTLAAEGLGFSQFYNRTMCHSFRVSLLTDLYCGQAGGAKLDRGATIAEGPWPLPDWPRAKPAEVGMRLAKLEAARDYALSGGGSGYITRHGKLVLAWGDVR